MHAGKVLASRRDRDGAYTLMSLESLTEGRRIYHELAEGGIVLMPLSDTSVGMQVAMLRDRFGTSWILVCSGRVEIPCVSR